MTSSRRRRACAGQTLVFAALVFALVLFGLVCLVADASYMFDWSDRLQAAAQLAAQSGADSVNPRYLYGASCTAPGCSNFIVDVTSADRRGSLYAFQRACIEAGDQSASVPAADGSGVKPPDAPQTPEGTACDSDGCHVFAVVTRVLPLPVEFPGFPASVTLHASAYAAPVVGQTTARLVCTGGPWLPSSP